MLLIFLGLDHNNENMIHNVVYHFPLIRKVPQTGIPTLDSKLERISMSLKFKSIKLSQFETQHLPNQHYFMAGSNQIGVEHYSNGTSSIFTIGFLPPEYLGHQKNNKTDLET